MLIEQIVLSDAAVPQYKLSLSEIFCFASIIARNNHIFNHFFSFLYKFNTICHAIHKLTDYI